MRRSVLDLDVMRVKKLLYELERKYCPDCQTYLPAKVSALLPKMLLSNELLAEVVESHYVHGIPLGRITARLQVNYSTIIDSLHRLGKLFAPCMESLIEEYRQAMVRHADETTWRVDGANGYCWLFSSARLSLYLLRHTRSATVVKEVFGTKQLEGYLVVDRYNGYNRVPCKGNNILDESSSTEDDKSSGDESIPYDAFRHFRRVYFLGDPTPEDRLIAVFSMGDFTFYGDESYGDGADAYAVAGYVASVEQWEKFIEQWKQFAKDEEFAILHKADLEFGHQPAEKLSTGTLS